MRKFECEQFGRVIVMNLSKGELVLENIKEELAKSGVRNAILTSGIGSLRRISIHGIKETTDQPSDYFIDECKPVELGSMQGLVLDGQPHIHIVANEPDGTVYVGHLEPGCEVQFLIELSFIEIKDMDLTRRLDEFGIGYIDKK